MRWKMGQKRENLQFQLRMGINIFSQNKNITLEKEVLLYMKT